MNYEHLKFSLQDLHLQKSQLLHMFGNQDENLSNPGRLG